ncbi:MAG: YggS family pyridoxal phosphate-dependent enzyme, partial [Brevundimonas sp.]
MVSSSPDHADASSVARCLRAVRDRMARACCAAGRTPDSVVLTAVTKTQPPEAIDAVLAAGQRV